MNTTVEGICGICGARILVDDGKIVGYPAEAQLKEAEELSTLKGLMAGNLLLIIKESYRLLDAGKTHEAMHYLKDALANADIDVEEPPQYGEGNE